MTAGNQGDGTNPPENDDPFGYLYRSDDGSENQDAAGGRGGYGGPVGPSQPGVPRTSYNQVRAVGERSYGGQPPAAGQPPHRADPSPHYAAPETQPGGRAAARHRPEDGPGPGRPPRRNGLLIGSIGVVAAVVVGVGAAILFSDGGGEEDPRAGESSSPSPTGEESPGQDDPKPDPSASAPPDLPSGDAATFTLGGDPTVETTVPGAEAQNGTYVMMNKPGASATWTTEIAEGGSYRLYLRYGVPGKDMNLTLYVNGEKQSRPLNMGNFANAEEGEWDKGWTQTWATVNATQGSNTFRIACEDGNACEVNLDRAWIALDEES